MTAIAANKAKKPQVAYKEGSNARGLWIYINPVGFVRDDLIQVYSELSEEMKVFYTELIRKGGLIHIPDAVNEETDQLNKKLIELKDKGFLWHKEFKMHSFYTVNYLAFRR